MLASLDHTDESRSSFVSSYRPTFDKYKPTIDKYRPTIDKYVKKFTPKQSPEEVRRAKHNKKVHRYDGHLPTPNWHITVHKGIGPAKDKAYEYAYDRWYAFGSHRWSPFVPYPYYHFEIRKGVGIATRETGKILGDFWWDVGNDKWVYGIKQFIGVVTGIVGWYRGTSPFGIISSPVVGYIWASAEHYIERRFFIFNSFTKITKGKIYYFVILDSFMKIIKIIQLNGEKICTGN